MESLLQQLKGINTKSPQDSFPDIAKNLMRNYIIKKGKKRFAIVEIEFYLFSKEHADYITYPRKMDEGRWFFHQSGVDLTFQTQGEPELLTVKDKNGKNVSKLSYKNCSFGGILLRGLYDIQNDEYIFGPQKCVNVLWDNFYAFHISESQYPIIEKELLSTSMHFYQCPRHINIQGEDKRETKIKEWIKRLGIENLEDIDIKDYQRKYFEAPYRFFNLLNEEVPWKFSKIPANIRPKKDETKEIR